MEKKIAFILIGSESTPHNKITFSLSINGQIITQSFLLLDGSTSAGMIFHWLLQQCHPLFFEYLPINSLTFEISDQLKKSGPEINNNFLILQKVIQNTNQVIINNLPNKNKIKKSKNILIYNVDNNSFINELANTLKDDNVLFHDNMLSGFDVTVRQWKTGTFCKTSDMVENCLKNEIGKIISINMYYVNALLSKELIFFPAVASFLGIEYIIFDSDTYELVLDGYFQYAALNPANKRFSLLPDISKAWTEKFNLKNIVFIPETRQYKAHKLTTAISEDFNFLIYANSRIDNLKNSIPQTLFYLDSLDQDHIFQDLQTFYYALKHLIFNKLNYSQSQIAATHKTLSTYHLMALCLLKFEVIDNLKECSDRKILIYGDNGWNDVFPEYFQHRYLNPQDIETIYAEKKHLHITFNQNYSYLTNNAIHTNAILAGNPFVAFPSLCRTPNLDGFKQIEYDNVQSLKKVIDNIHTSVASESYLAAVQNYLSIRSQSMDAIHDYLTNSNSDGLNLFMDSFNQHEQIATSILDDYIVKNAQRLAAFFNTAFFGGQTSYDYKKSLYYQKKYVQKILGHL